MSFVLLLLVVGVGFGVTAPFWVAFARATTRREPTEVVVRPRRRVHRAAPRPVPVATGCAAEPAFEFAESDATAPYDTRTAAWVGAAPAKPAATDAVAFVDAPPTPVALPAVSSAESPDVTAAPAAALLPPVPPVPPVAPGPPAHVAVDAPVFVAAPQTGEDLAGTVDAVDAGAGEPDADADTGPAPAEAEAAATDPSGMLYDQDATAERTPLDAGIAIEDPSLYDQDATAERRRF